MTGALLLLAGCATPPHEQAGMTDFPAVTTSSEPLVSSSVSESAVLAPPPAIAPQVPTNAVSAPKVIKAGWVRLDAWTRSRSLPPPKRRPADQIPTFEVSTPSGPWVIRPGTEVTLWNGVQLRLSFAPQMTNAMPLVHSFDLAKTIDPLLSKSAGAVSPAPVIVLDPGHGGQDSGTSSVLPGKFEKDMVLDWALRLRDLLTARGWQVKLTRTNDCDLSIPARVAIADQVKADLFVSLHFNSAGTKYGESGAETYCLTPAGMPSNLTRGYPDDLRTTFPNNTFDEENLRLALALHRELLQTSHTADRGVRRARFLGVLRGQQRPAVLVEGGYLSNAAEARLIATGAYRQKLADGLAKALVEWSGAQKSAQQLAAGASPSGE